MNDYLRHLWNVLSIFMLVSIVVLFRYIFIFREEITKLGGPHNNWEDLYTAGAALVAIFAVRGIGAAMLKPGFLARLKSIDETNYELKKHKVTKEFFSLLWYIFIVVYGNIALYNHPYIPSILNGAGTCDTLMRNYGTLSGDDVVKKYYLIQMAHHMYSLLDHLFLTPKQKDFAEMALHHLCTMAAIIFSYFTNQVAIGATILLIHDYGDIFLNMGKTIRDMKLFPSLTFILDAIYLALFVTWFFPRVVIIGGCVIPAGVYIRHFDLTFSDPRWQKLSEIMVPVDVLQITLVAIIMVLNFVWSMVILKVGYKKFTSKSSGYAITVQGEKVK